MLVVIARLAGFTGGALVLGAPLVYLRAPSDPPHARTLTLAGVLLLVAAAVAALVGQTAVMAGDPAAGSDPEMLRTVLTDTGFGRALAARVALALLALAALWTRPRALRWTLLVLLGAGALGSFAWTGHGAADEGARGLFHLAADLAHLAAAGVWLGALGALLAMALQARRPIDQARLAKALEDFSGVGAAVVATLLASGLVNGWFLVGPDHLGALPTSLYGQLLLAKLVLFAAMLGLAALNRFRLTPALAAAAGAPDTALAALVRSLGLETLLGALVLVLVAALGAMAPLSAQ